MTPTDNILDWNSTNSRDQSYTDKLVSDPGYTYFYTGANNPTTSSASESSKSVDSALEDLKGI